jgi:hypothetical protein
MQGYEREIIVLVKGFMRPAQEENRGKTRKTKNVSHL